MDYITSFLFGGIIGFICAAIFAVILRRLEESNRGEVKKLLALEIFLIVGGGLADFVIFDLIIRSNFGIVSYLWGFSCIFLPLGLLTFLDWRK
jgi:hypothetical protein